MVSLSPINTRLISNKSNSTKMPNGNNDKHENIYQNLIAESVVIKPNKAKAVLVRENPLQSVVSSVKDFINDGKNFFIAAKTGKMDDNSLGRINDFGMLAGGLIIATFLASRAKTKTSALMQYIGGGAFFASMALWPKLFINLPAKLIHGFRIDQKYISAQGEKKDFFLDNQFLPWDAFSQDELRQNAKRAGINYDSENGDEKIKRKMQKTALQNRTLWMATAGFATPLMTALFGDFVEPKVKDAVIKNGFRKSQKALKNFDKTIVNAKPIVRNAMDIDEVIRQFELGKINGEEMIKSLAKNLSIDFAEVFKDIDDIKTIKNLKFEVDTNVLKNLREQKSVIEEENLVELLKKAFVQGKDALENEFENLQGAETIFKQGNLSPKAIEEIAEKFSKSDKKTYQTLRDIILPYAKKANMDIQSVNQTMSKIPFKYDDRKFYDAVKEYNVSTLGQIRGRLAKYLETILNPVIGSKDESVYTDLYRKAMKKILPEKSNILGIPVYDKKTIKVMEAIRDGGSNLVEQNGAAQIRYSVSEAMSKLFAHVANIKDDNQYITELKKMFVEKDDSISNLLKLATDKRNIEKIASVDVTDNKEMFDAMTGNISEIISKIIKNFSELADVNTDAIRVRTLLAANLERRIAKGEFEKALVDAGMITQETPLKEWIKKARYLIYEGTVASDACLHEFKNEAQYIEKLKPIIFDSQQYAAEKSIFPELDKILDGLKNIGKGKPITPKDNARATGIANLEKNVVTDILNNRSWKKIVIPSFIALVAITLLVQPLFGKIKKEFPQEDKEGGKK